MGQNEDRGESIIPNDSIESCYAEEWRDETLEALRQIRGNHELMAEVGEAIAQFERGEFDTCRTPAEMESMVAARAGRRA